MEKKRHVLFLSSWFPSEEHPFLGNFVQRHLHLIAQHNRVTFLNLKPVRSVNHYTLTSNISGNLTEVTVSFPARKNPFMKWWSLRKAFRMAVQTVHDVDLIHGNVMLPKGIQFVWAKNHFNKPLLVTEHASYFEVSKRKHWRLIERLILRKVTANADLITAVSPFLQSEIEAAFPDLKVQILPNIIDESIFKLKPSLERELTQFVHISTLDERYKNVGGILASCAQLKKKIGARFHLLVISDEPYAAWQQKVDALHLTDCVSFAGPMTSAEIAIELQQADALILFSTYETFSCVVAESWATGTPVISTPVGIAKDLKSTLGIQVENQDTRGLMQAMQSFVDNEYQFEPQQLRAEASAYFSEKVSECIEQLYQSLEKAASEE